MLNNLGTIAYFAGRWNEALDLYRQAVAAWDQAGDTRSVSMASFNIGEILSAQGRLEEAEPLLREAERASRAAGGASDIAESMMETALLDARRGNVERALAQLERGPAPARGERQPYGDAARRRAPGRGAPAGRRVRPRCGARRAHARARDRRRGQARSCVPVLNRVLGQAHLLAGRLDAAREALELAIAEANRVEHRYEEALALAALSRARRAPRARRARAGMRSSSSSASSPCPPAGSQPDQRRREARSAASLARSPRLASPRASGRKPALPSVVRPRGVRDERHPERDAWRCRPSPASDS